VQSGLTFTASTAEPLTRTTASSTRGLYTNNTRKGRFAVWFDFQLNGMRRRTVALHSQQPPPLELTLATAPSSTRSSTHNEEEGRLAGGLIAVECGHEEACTIGLYVPQPPPVETHARQQPGLCSRWNEGAGLQLV
jgi:hypothetical protein